MREYQVPVFFTVQAESPAAAREALISVLQGHADSEDVQIPYVCVANEDEIPEGVEVEPVSDEERSNGPNRNP